MSTAIRWFATNSVAANLLMVLLLVGGIVGVSTTSQQEFPDFDPKVVSVVVPYLGAAPIEVESGVCIRIEEAVEGVEGIERIQIAAVEGACHTLIELTQSADETLTLNEIKSRVDSINSFPAETEKPVISKIMPSRRVVQVALYGEVDDLTLKDTGQRLRDTIARAEGISQVGVAYARPFEISIEVSEQTLRQYGIDLATVAQAVRVSSFDMPGGTIRSDGGEILIRTIGQAYSGEDFENIVVLTRQDGTRITLGEVAVIRDAFEEGNLAANFNGQSAVMVSVSQVGDEDLMRIAEDAAKIVEAFSSTLPPGVKTELWIDTSLELKERMSVLLVSAGGGLILVLGILALFLQVRLALWVAVGIPVALMGTMAIVPFTDMTISTLTIMGFILVLGIVVDDAIVVAERIYAHEEMGKRPMAAAIDGTNEVSIPVIFGVLTTIAAFLPMVVVQSQMADFFSVIGWIVIFALTCSIVESQLILPTHLAHRQRTVPPKGPGRRWHDFQSRLSLRFSHFAEHRYVPFIQRAIAWRYATAAVCLGILLMAFALLFSGRVMFGFFPPVEGNRVYAALEMPEGFAASSTEEAAIRIADAAEAMNKDLTAELGLARPLIQNVLVSVGQTVDRDGPAPPQGPGRSNLAEVVIDLQVLKERKNISAKVIANRWREYVGSIPDAVSLSFDAEKYSMGKAIAYELRGSDVERLRQAAEDLKAQLSRFPGVLDISDSFRSGKQEIQLALLPEARNLGLTLNDLASQVRAAFYGVEVQRVQRGQEDIRVMVRFPERERRSIGNLEDMYIHTPNGTKVPFYSVARFEIERGYSQIRRKDGQRVVDVSADVDRDRVTPEEINATIISTVIPILKVSYPDIAFDIGGEQEERAGSLGGLLLGFLISLFVIYGLLAIPLKSYFQPLVIMSAIPFGAVGAVSGHYLLGQQLVFFSALGIVALGGIVVNASLVLVDFANRLRRQGTEMQQAIIEAARTRFRPITLTSVTTFIGLVPLMYNKTPATAPFIPMAVSLAFGVLFATFITLILVPCLYVMLEDMLGDKPEVPELGYSDGFSSALASKHD